MEKGKEWSELDIPGFTSVKTNLNLVEKRLRLAGHKKSSITLSTASILETQFSAVNYTHEYLQKNSEILENFRPAPTSVVIENSNLRGHDPGWLDIIYITWYPWIKKTLITIVDFDENRQPAVEIIFHITWSQKFLEQGKYEHIFLTRSIFIIQFTNWCYNALCRLHILMEILVRIDKDIETTLQHVLDMEIHLYSTNYWID